MKKTYEIEVVGRVCILNEVSAQGTSERVAAGTPKMCGDAIRIALTNAIAGAKSETRSGGGL